ncbi:hypothetical protein [Nocardia sp. NPDC046763]|uniref:hypothetical protein n=1 Tax=Nocardia sp. NPDC046763 TaxID=3155256 RepID=UPI0033FAB82C
MPVRTLTVRGGNEQIGADLAGLGHSDHAARIAPYGDPARARPTSLERNHSTLAAAPAVSPTPSGVPVDGNEFDTAAVGYDIPERPACSAVWCQPALTTTGHPMIGRNVDRYIRPLRHGWVAGIAPVSEVRRRGRFPGRVQRRRG